MESNVFDNVPVGAADEVFTDLLRRPGVRIERIVSNGQASQDWYDQEWDEWVLVLDGEGERVLLPGDHVLLSAHRRHRVAWTDAEKPTIWLAVHIGEPEIREELNRSG